MACGPFCPSGPVISFVAQCTTRRLILQDYTVMTVLSEEAEARLRRSANVTMNEDGRNWTSAEVAERLPGVDAMLASWGQPKLTEQELAMADRLRIIGYAAGSIKGWVSDAVFQRGVFAAIHVR
jgi:phosphoglycerate dehydrogenase-like enzyme